MIEQHFIVSNQRDAARVFQSLQGLQGQYEVIVKPYVENRRRAQENLYRSWCRLIAAHTGNDCEHIHVYFKRKFLGTELASVKFKWHGKPVDVEQEQARSTTTLNMKEMSAFMHQVSDFSREFIGLHLPESDDVRR